jgi:phosphomannomutase
MIYVFDVDGTLTPFRSPMVPDFYSFFLDWSKHKRIWLATGSDIDKTIEQIGIDLFNRVERSYQSNGNQIYSHGKLLKEAPEFNLPQDCIDILKDKLATSSFGFRKGKHFEERPGALNFSIIGRNCNMEERKIYVDFDESINERKNIITELSPLFPDIEFAIGGEISIDIYPKGSGKGQLVNDLDDNFTFIGDNLYPSGNDYSVYTAAVNKNIHTKNTFFNVTGYEETWRILNSLI